MGLNSHESSGSQSKNGDAKVSARADQNMGGAACGKFVSGDPDNQRQTWNFSIEEIKDPPRNEGCEKVGLEPGTP